MSDNKQNAFEETIDLRDIIRTILSHKWTVLLTTIIFMVLAACYCYLRAPVYQANVLLNISDQASNALSSTLRQGMPAAGGFFRGAGSDPVVTEQNVLTSRAVLLPVVEKLKLDVAITPHYFPVIGKTLARHYENTNYYNKPAPAKFGLHKYNWGGATIAVSAMTVTDNLYSNKFTLTAGENGHYTLSYPGSAPVTGTVNVPTTIKVEPYGEATLTVSKLNANPGAEFTLSKANPNAIMTALSNQISAQQPDKFTSLINVSLKGNDPINVSHTLNAVAESAVAQSVNEKSEQAAKTLSFLQDRLPKVEKSLIAAEQALNDYKSESGNIALDEQTKGLLMEMGNLQTQIAQLMVDKTSLEQEYTDNSYQIRSLETRIKSLKNLQLKLQDKIKGLPQSDQKLMQLTRDVTIQNKVFSALLSNIQQYELLKESTIGDVQIVDHASVPYININKPASLVKILGAILGFFVSIAFIFIRQYFFNGIENPEVVENKFGLPVLGALHQSKLQTNQLKALNEGSQKYLKVLEEIDSHDFTVEGFRSLRTNLMFELAKTDNNIISISGPVPNVGKSFVSINIAAALAESGKKVLLIDGDIRKGDLYQYFLKSRYPGLCDFLAGTATKEECIHATRVENLSFLPTGRLPKKQTQLLLSKNFEDLMAALKTEYDLIVIDTAPVLAVTDAFLIGRLAGIRLLVLGYGMHNDHEIEHTLQRYQKAGIPLNGCIFNLIKSSNSALSYRYQYRYSYQTKEGTE